MTKDNHNLGKFDLKASLLPLSEDKGTGKKEKITITNDKGRLSQEDIDRMVQEAEEFAEEDKLIKERVDARNSLETYCYNMKNSVEDEDKLADKLDESDKETVSEAVQEALDWMDENQEAEAEEYKEKLKELEDICNPIISQAYQGAGGEDEDEDLGDHDEL
eukprot:CAMPEP_0168616904 /NCGR_PEP_ID=MMETSP0449_2-20121227/5269_1 /TAXON_ID=1082188 /ORGANISM="Strombidium rassoulzadegani, Strain ras09" /LENGTH=161 /DNA_ID=CAMNT_0008657707 /DNA_START=38 /DNA_END=524 /DNA_ORIENTATION=+